MWAGLHLWRSHSVLFSALGDSGTMTHFQGGQFEDGKALECVCVFLESVSPSMIGSGSEALVSLSSPMEGENFF